VSVAAVILAAGEGGRFGRATPKLRAAAKGRPLIAWALDAAREAELDELVVVIGAADLSDLVPEEATVLENEGWRNGEATSLGVALDWCHRQGHAAAVVGLADMPGVTVDGWLGVADAPPAPIVAASYGGRRSYPVRLEASMWSLLPTSGDEGIPALMRTRPELVVEVACEGRPDDIDTPEDLRRWK
jgi:CTP:molybdopterin cytidylyltransferase MocA